ncbi:MAG: PEGA domain-containing protein, partial [Candidatus Marinimicrobia bacterium]|nr:PEGA domain-containing protein [Candidatus Neomarinimicrobiota bacterium]
MSSLFGAKYLAVLDLEPVGLSETEAKVLTQRLTSKMIELSDFIVVERANIDKILKEQKFQHSGCTDSECAVEIGQLLNADVSVIGTASKFGKTYTLDCRIINVESGEAIESASYTHTGEIDELVKEGIESIAHKLLGIPYKKKISSGTTSKASSGYGATLDISSDPPGAEVYIGGNYFDTTPLILEDFPIGDYEVEIKLDGYEDYIQSIKLLPRGTEILIANLTGIPSYIEFRGNPRLDKLSRLTVDIDGLKQYIGRYDNKIEVLSGKHIIKVSGKGYLDYVDTVLVIAGQTANVTYELTKNAGFLKASVNPSNARLYIDDSFIGWRDAIELSPGIYTIKASKDGYDDYTGEFEIKLDETTERSIDLIEQFGHLDLKLSPYNAKVYFNDEKAMELNLPFSDSFDNKASEFKLRPGTYDVRAEKPFYYTKSMPATIKNKERTDLTLTLEAKSRSVAKKRAWMFPGLGHIYADAPSKGQKWLILGGASIIGTAY